MMRRKLMFVTDVGMIAYWGVTCLFALGLVNIPGEYLFKDYHIPHTMAWNWSFFPLDIVLSLTGLRALQLEKRDDARWKSWALIS